MERQRLGREGRYSRERNREGRDILYGDRGEERNILRVQT